MESCTQVGLRYQFEKSQQQAGSGCRRFVQPRFEKMPVKQALDHLLKPYGVGYAIEEKGLYLRSQR